MPFAGSTSGSDRNLCVGIVVTIVPYAFYMVYMLPSAGAVWTPMGHLCVVAAVIVVTYVFYMVSHAGNARTSMRNLCVVIVDASFPI